VGSTAFYEGGWEAAEYVKNSLSKNVDEALANTTDLPLVRSSRSGSSSRSISLPFSSHKYLSLGSVLSKAVGALPMM